MNIAQHPCFNKSAHHKYGRVHLPIAPKCNIKCHFCNRRYDCQNESRPGVTTTVLAPEQALHYLGKVVAQDPRIRVVGIAGPGDAFANPQQLFDTLELIRSKYPDLLICLATNGLALPAYVERLKEFKVSHVTVTINALDPVVGAQIYAWVRDGKKIYRGSAGAKLLLERQLESIAQLKAAGITVKVNSIVIPHVNELQIADIASKVSALGADLFNAMPLYPTAKTLFEHAKSPSEQLMASIRAQVDQFIPAMRHCRRCRADAVGLLGEEHGADKNDLLLESASFIPNAALKPYVAVASRESALVNQHLGEARKLWIFQKQEHGYLLAETRKLPAKGSGDHRWRELALMLSDCRALLCAGAGGPPRTILTAAGIKVIETDCLIAEGLAAVYGGQPAPPPKRPAHDCHDNCRCGSKKLSLQAATERHCAPACSGNGMGCD